MAPYDPASTTTLTATCVPSARGTWINSEEKSVVHRVEREHKGWSTRSHEEGQRYFYVIRNGRKLLTAMHALEGGLAENHWQYSSLTASNMVMDDT